jgi:hypothetical protein
MGAFDMAPLKVYTCTTFSGRWPVGTAAVVAANDAAHAADLLSEQLRRIHLSQKLGAKDMIEFDMTKPFAFVLNDGDY